MGLTDVELWDRARDGDAPAFGQLFDRHARAVYNFCFRRTGSWSIAEDLTSLVFLEGWRARARVDLERESALPWLYGIALNVTRNHQRTMRRRRGALERLSPPEATPDIADDVAPRVDAEREMRAVLARIAALPQADQDVLAVCSWAELPYSDAAAVLGIPIGTVRSRMARARARLGELDQAAGHNRGDEPMTAPVSEVTP